MAVRNVIKISVTPAAKGVVAKASARTGITEQTIASRVYEWWASQDDVLRMGILGVLPEGYEVDVAKIALERLAASGNAKK